MLLHVRPALLSSLAAVQLIDLKVEPFGLVLTGTNDLATRRPYSNKHFVVACRRQGRKAIGGILIDTPHHVAGFQVTARWAIGACFVATHHVTYRLLDHDFDAASDNMCLWYGTSEPLGGFPSRWPDWAHGLAPMNAQPIMELVDRASANRTRDDQHNGSGSIVTRREVFAMLTIERERLFHRVSAKEERSPTLDAAFLVRANSSRQLTGN